MNCDFTELWLYWTVTLLNCYFTELWLYWTVTVAELWLYWTVTLLNCDCTELWLYWTVTLLNCYFTELWLYWIVTVLNCDCTELWLYFLTEPRIIPEVVPRCKNRTRRWRQPETTSLVTTDYNQTISSLVIKQIHQWSGWTIILFHQPDSKAFWKKKQNPWLNNKNIFIYTFFVFSLVLFEWF